MRVKRFASSEEATALTLSTCVSHLNLCLLLDLFSNASDALRAARADGRHYVPLSLNRLGRVINTHGDILVSNAKMGQNRAKLKKFLGPCDSRVHSDGIFRRPGS